MAVITLTTDWGLSDHYVASVKGLIINGLPDVHIIDISHSIPQFGLAQAAYILKNCYKNFPLGSVHIIGVNSDEIIEKNKEENSVYHKLILYDGHYFVGADNGIFSLICNSKPEKIILLTANLLNPFFTFHAYFIYADVACKVLSGLDPEKLGQKTEHLYKMNDYKPLIEKDTIKGMVVYIDSYGNAITNINYHDFMQIKGNRRFTVFIKNEIFDTIHKTYSEVPSGELVLVWNSQGFLEMAQNRGNLHKLFGICIYDPVRIEFLV